MAGPRILLVVGGGIAAYKSCELVRLIRKGGGDVTCVLTDGGAQFVTPMSLAALSGNQVHSSLWDLKDEAEIGHIQLSRAADLVVVCPATADLLAKMAAGIADDLGTTLILATDKPVLAVPGMNVKMWEHEATQRNVALLREAGVTVLDPDEGEMACGEYGPGRLPEPEAVWLEIADALGLDPGDAGPKEIADYLEALEPEEEPEAEHEEEHKKGGLGGLLASIIPRSTPRKIADEEVIYHDLPMEDLPAEDVVDAEPDLDHPLFAKKGKAKAAPPTDREAINHEVNANQVAPEPTVGEPTAVPVAPPPPAPAAPVEIVDDPLEGQGDFDVAPDHRPLHGKHVLVTAGPTWEGLDPVRYITNRSSGKQGFAIAAAAAALGARVTLVAGPVHLATPLGVDRIDVESADEMQKAVKKALPADAAVLVAAVSDWRTREYSDHKIKKRGDAPPALLLQENPDILVNLAAEKKRPKVLIGFAAETDDLIANAKKKRKNKGADWIVANDVSGGRGKSVMGGDENHVTIVTEKGEEEWDPMSKKDVALKLMQKVADELA
ncbi:bifunctional phosphopantothenoylcysteine decarboxylase/phosphopantothenate synthase [Altererythrobacter salegens]|uniref:Coenzyme A biosynthesis bifunctional protein CoaBC n=1 Tax=Croceibacterium salegens TaxID=1737568 RepID=A0A6I4SUF9_9SPHN|nr:bifunctional phosphopantothenoylcysteine decarboxylase/phosphopantothenate synthase [Croceibacterium salegens]MXO59068.1 bifunctional phosphopantothenoylcysteine decarboxylase/phosphopantothenate synthase [Croceibacterium salegens]